MKQFGRRFATKVATRGKMKKMTAIALLVAAMAFTACSSTEEKKVETAPAPAAEVKAPAAAPAPVATPAAAPAKTAPKKK